MSRINLFSGVMAIACAAWMLPALAITPADQSSADTHNRIAQTESK